MKIDLEKPLKICLAMVIFLSALLISAWAGEPSLLWRKSFDAPVVKTSNLKDFELSGIEKLQFPLDAVMTTQAVFILDEQGNIARQIPLAGYQKAVFSANGAMLAALKEKELSIFNSDIQIQAKISIEDPRVLILPQRALLELSPKGQYLILAPYFGNSIYFYSQKGEMLSQHQVGDLKEAKASFSSDGSYVVMHLPNWGEGKTTGYLFFFDNQGKKLWQFDHPGCEAKFALSSDGDSIVLATEEKLYSLNRNGKLTYEKELVPGGVDIALSGNGEYLVITRRAEHSITLLDNRSGKALWTSNISGFDPINSPFTSLALSQNAEFVAITLSKDWTNKNKESFLYIFDNAGRMSWQKEFEEPKIETHLSQDGRCIEVIAAQEVYLYNLLQN